MNERIDRRAFMRRGGAVMAGSLAALAAPGPAGYGEARAGQFTGKIKKALKYHMIDEKLSVEDKFKLVKDLGYDGTEIRTRDKVDPKRVERAIEKTGLPVHGVINSSNPDIKSAIDLAKRWGGDSVLTTVPNDKRGDYMANYRERQEIIKRAASHAEKERVHVLIENVWASFLIEPLSMARFIDEIDSPYVGSYFDVGNVVRWGWPHHWIQVLGRRIGKLDIKEYDLSVAMSEGMRKGFGDPLGEGSVPWDLVREELANIDFRSWATAEVPGGDRERLADIAAQMDRVLDL